MQFAVVQEFGPGPDQVAERQPTLQVHVAHRVGLGEGVLAGERAEDL